MFSTLLDHYIFGSFKECMRAFAGLREVGFMYVRMCMCARACVRPMYAGCRCGVVLNTALVLQVFGLTRKPRGKDERHTFNRSRSRDQILGVLKNGLFIYFFFFFGCRVYSAYYEGGGFLEPLQRRTSTYR